MIVCGPSVFQQLRNIDEYIIINFYNKRRIKLAVNKLQSCFDFVWESKVRVWAPKNTLVRFTLIRIITP